MDSSNQADPNSIEYWRKQAKHYEQKASDIQQELDEYTENSAQLEKELEASLVQVEKQNRDLEHQNFRLKNEIEMLRKKLDRSQAESNALENELQILKAEKEKQATYVRELEQKNDDLERGQRVITETVSYIEAMMNQAIERNAVLESEMDEVEALKVKLQRATDEARDLKQELKVKEKVSVKGEVEDNANENVMNGHAGGDTSRVNIDPDQATASPVRREVNGNTITPSSRVSAMNIVGDLLRRVGLERFLCPDCGKVRCACDPPKGSDAKHCVPYNCTRPQDCSVDELNNIEYRRPQALPYKQETIPQPPLQPKRLTRLSSETQPPLDSDARPLSETHNLPTHLSLPPKSQPRTSGINPRHSETPFVRSTGENGKLRRSFIVRSREGIENLMSTLRKPHDTARVAKPPLARTSS